MATDILDNAYISINSNVLTTKANQVEINYEVETQDDTTFGDTTRSNLGGLKNWSITVQFVQDFANGVVDSLLFSQVGNVVPFEIRPDAGSVGVNNPKFTGNALIRSYRPLGGSVGDLMTATLEMVPGKGGGTATLNRATA